MRLPSLICALGLVGCAASGDEGMIVLNNTAVTGDSCSLSGDPGQPFLPHGYIHADSPSGYVLTPLIQSRIANDIGTGMGGTGTATDPNSRTILFRGADVTLTVKSTEISQNNVYMTNGAERALPAFSVLFSGSLPPNGTANVAFEAMSASQIRDVVNGSGVNREAGQNVRVEVLAEVTIKGTLGGDEVTASPFNYPISVCTDCVVLPACEQAMQDPNPCNPYQDGTFCQAIITP